MELEYLAALRLVPGIGDARIRAGLYRFGSPRSFWSADEAELTASRCLDGPTLSRLLTFRRQTDVEALGAAWRDQGIFLCGESDREYPESLRHIFNPPLVLFYRGRLPNHNRMIAVVGSRKSTTYGRNAAGMIAAGLTAAGVWVVSGAARGIDTAAHRGALKHGYTVAVLGCGVDVAYPPENRQMLDEIAEHGAVLSEYPPGTPPSKGYFPARNRIINGMVKGVLVVEASERSGALITSDMALEEGRDVFAVPGSIFSEASVGPNRLLKLGAKAVTSADDILEEYGWEKPNPEQHPDETLSSTERQVFDRLSPDNPLSVDELAAGSGLPAGDVIYILLQLELRGLAAEHAGRRYCRAVREGVR